MLNQNCFLGQLVEDMLLQWWCVLIALVCGALSYYVGVAERPINHGKLAMVLIVVGIGVGADQWGLMNLSISVAV
jgi:hypothetical protein